MVSVGAICLTSGVALIMYTAYAVVLYRDEMKLTQQEFEGLPPQLVTLLAGAVGIATLGMYRLSGDLRPIAVTKGQHSMDLNSLRTDFMSFNHRSRAIPMTIPAVD
ncbi:hypothetical protein BSKO_04260 [Bryopsis sp. KO-2023]|nr:hypothetical protein BSKO_04260 [Bryopsis sp. KO-2023]